MQKYSTIDTYIKQFPTDVAAKLTTIKKLVKEIVPEAKETIKYGIPTFTLKGNLVHFAGYNKHIGFYPTPSAIAHFKNDLTKYKLAKGSVQFPLDEQLPLTLIRKIVEFRVKESK